MSIELVDALLLEDKGDVIGTVGVRPNAGGAGGLPGKEGTGMLGTAGGGMGAGRACAARVPTDGGGGGRAADGVGPPAVPCGIGGAEPGKGGGAAGADATGGGAPPENIGGGGGGGAPPNVGAACAFPPGIACADVAIGAPEGKGKPPSAEDALGVDCGVAVAPSFGSGGGGNPRSVFCRIGGGAALLVGGAGGKLGGGGGGGAAPNAEGAGPSPAEEDFFDRSSSKTSRSDPPLSLMMRSFS